MSEHHTPHHETTTIATRIERAGLTMLTREYATLQEQFGAHHAYELLAPSEDEDRSVVRSAILNSPHALSELYLADLFAAQNKPASGTGNWQKYAQWESEWRRQWAWSAVATATNTDPQKVADHFPKVATDHLTLPQTIIDCVGAIEQASVEVRHTLGSVALSE